MGSGLASEKLFYEKQHRAHRKQSLCRLVRNLSQSQFMSVYVFRYQECVKRESDTTSGESVMMMHIVRLVRLQTPTRKIFVKTHIRVWYLTLYINQ